MRSLQRGAVAALLVTTACAVAACGGGGSSAATTSASTTANTTTSAAGAARGANGAAFAKYTSCLKQHGVTLPSFGQGRPPGGGGQGTAPTGTAPNPPTGTNRRRGGFGQFNTPAFQKAAAACASLRPKFTGGFGGGFGGRGGGQNSAAFAAYRNCLTLHGVKTAGGFGFGRPGGAAPTAKEKAALSACASLRPARQGRPTGTTATPSTTS